MIQNEKDFFIKYYAHCAEANVLEIIWQAKQRQAPTLDLTGRVISDLSPLEDLVDLYELGISLTKVSDLSPLKNLINLEALTVSETKVSDLSPLKDLTNLRQLIANETRVRDLSPLITLTNLQYLNVSSTQVSDLSALKKLIDLQLLYVSNTQVSNLSPLKDLIALKQLYAFNTRINDLSPLKDLSALQLLYISETHVRDLSPLKDLSALQLLYISETHVRDLSPLKNLSALQLLYISETQVSDLSPLKGLTSLHKLDIYSTQVSDLSPLKDLTALQKLNFNSTQVSDLSPLKDLTALKLLRASKTKVSDLSPLKDLTALQQLDVNSTQVSDLSPLKDLSALQLLYISETHVSDLSPLKDLTALQQLDIENCFIQYIPKEIYDQYNCANDLKAYWKDIKQSQTTTNNQLKIMFLGNGCVGKTTLLHWFLDNAFKDLSLEDGRTHGIIIQPYKFKDSDVLAHFWDFGGQEVYHATHRLFLGRRSLYLLVWATESPDAAHEERHPPQYWLDMIADIGGHERSRVLIVQNLFDGQTERNILTDAERQDYEARGLDITTYCVNAKTGLKIKSLKTAIEEEAEQLLKTNIEELPTSWVNIRKAVADKRLAKDKTLSWADFENICRDCELTTDPTVILGYLHCAGELFHYHNQFDNQIILDQEWALKAVYAVLKRDRIERFKGVFTLEDLRDFWQKDNPNLTEDEAKIFLNFMLANKTMFYTEGGYHGNDENPEFVIPQLLPTTEPNRYRTWQRITDKTRHRIQYAFLHRDIIERFIVATAHLSKNKDYWNNGLFIEYGEDEAMVEVVVDEKDDKIKYIHIECTGRTQTELLKTIREEFNKIRILDKAKEYRFTNGNWTQVTGEIIQRAEDMGGFKDKAPIFDFPKKAPISLQLTTENSMKQYLLDLIADGKLKEALDLMRQISNRQDSYFGDSVIGFLSRYSRNERDKGSTISTEDYRMEYNRIENSTKSLLNSEFDESTAPTPPKVAPKEENKQSTAQAFISEKENKETASSKLKILMMTANPAGTTKLNLDKEYARISEKLQDKQEQFNLIVRRAVSDTEFKEFTETIKPAIIHFSGHGEDGQDGGIVVQNDDKNGYEMISTDSLDALFEYFTEEAIALKAVLLNACHTEEQAQTISKYVPYVLGTTVAIGDEAAIAFSTGFYFKLAELGATIEQAFRSGRTQAVMKKALKTHFVLYKDGKKLEL